MPRTWWIPGLSSLKLLTKMSAFRPVNMWLHRFIWRRGIRTRHSWLSQRMSGRLPTISWTPSAPHIEDWTLLRPYLVFSQRSLWLHFPYVFSFLMIIASEFLKEEWFQLQIEALHLISIIWKSQSLILMRRTFFWKENGNRLYIVLVIHSLLDYGLCLVLN